MWFPKTTNRFKIKTYLLLHLETAETQAASADLSAFTVGVSHKGWMPETAKSKLPAPAVIDSIQVPLLSAFTLILEFKISFLPSSALLHLVI